MLPIVLFLLSNFTQASLFDVDKVELSKKATMILKKIKESPDTVGNVILLKINEKSLENRFGKLTIQLPNGVLEVRGYIAIKNSDGTTLQWKHKKNSFSLTFVGNTGIGLICFDDKVYCLEPLDLNGTVHALRQIDQHKLKD